MLKEKIEHLLIFMRCHSQEFEKEIFDDWHIYSFIIKGNKFEISIFIDDNDNQTEITIHKHNKWDVSTITAPLKDWYGSEFEYNDSIDEFIEYIMNLV